MPEKYIKNFDEWNERKKSINDSSFDDFFYEREIWWCYLGANIGTEQNGKGDDFMRPVLVFKKFNKRMCWVIPLSTEVKKGNFFFPLLAESNIFRTAVLPQLRLIDIKRLDKQIDIISWKEYTFVREKVIAFIQ